MLAGHCVAQWDTRWGARWGTQWGRVRGPCHRRLPRPRGQGVVADAGILHRPFSPSQPVLSAPTPLRPAAPGLTAGAAQWWAGPTPGADSMVSAAVLRRNGRPRRAPAGRR